MRAEHVEAEHTTRSYNVGKGGCVTEEPVKTTPPPETPAKPPMTTPSFIAELEDLIKRAQDAGLNPLQIIVGLYARKGVTALDLLLGNLDFGKVKK